MSPSLPLVGEELAGYRLLNVVGRGGMSVVFHAENPRLGSAVALKVLAPELAANDVFRARFLKESRIAAALSHPNVIPIYDMGPSGELLYIAMRYVAGSDLRTVLKARGRLRPEQALALIGQAGRALDAAHRHDLVHRDIKPANILIERTAEDEPDHVYLADFGITKNALSRSGLTETGQFVGTIDYIAPEQIQGVTSVDGRADIYSLGCVLYECLTGRVPFVKEVDAAVIWAHVEEAPKPPSEVQPQLPAAIDDVIARALAKDPAERYQTAHELMDAARGALAGLGATERSPSAATSTETVLSGPVPVQGHAAAAPTAAAETAAAGGGRAAGATRTPQDVGSGVPTASSPAGAPPSSAGETVASADTTSSAEAREERTGSPPGGRRRPRARNGRLLALAGIVAAAIVAVALVLALGGGKSSPAKPAPEPGEARAATLAAVPSNRVNGAGHATVHLNGKVATVVVEAHGLLNNAPHAMHIHAGGLGTCPPASAARLHNGHLSISTTDGINFYGSVEAALTTSGDTSVQSFLVFSRFPNTGTIRYKRKITLTDTTVTRLRKNNAVLVVHGIDYNGNGLYDDVLDRSELNSTVPGEATAPALCGPILPASSSGKTSASAGATYSVALSVDTGLLAWFCEPLGEEGEEPGSFQPGGRGQPVA